MRKTFQGDTNQLLKTIQMDLFPHIGMSLFTAPATRYLEAIRFIGVETDLYSKVSDAMWKGFSFYAMQPFYLHMAAWYRFAEDDHGQMVLPTMGPLDYENYLREKWLTFYHSEVDQLTKVDETARFLIRCIINENESDGESAMNELEIIFEDRYPFDIQRKPDLSVVLRANNSKP